MTDASDRGWGPGWPNCRDDDWVTITAAGLRWRVRAEIAELARDAIEEWHRTVEPLVGQVNNGSAVCRAIRGSDPPRPSNHSWGLALDLNSNLHPDGKRGTFTTAEVSAIRAWLAERPHWRWGGDWRGGDVDEMHVEYVGTPADAEAETRLLRGGTEEDGMATDETTLRTIIREEVAASEARIRGAVGTAVGNAGPTDKDTTHDSIGDVRRAQRAQDARLATLADGLETLRAELAALRGEVAALRGAGPAPAAYEGEVHVRLVPTT